MGDRYRWCRVCREGQRRVADRYHAGLSGDRVLDDGLVGSLKVSRELVQEREQFNAQMDEMAHQWSALETMREFNHELKRIDELLELIFVPEHADVTRPCRPGYWHVLRRNAGAPWSVIVLEDDQGLPCGANLEGVREAAAGATCGTWVAA